MISNLNQKVESDRQMKPFPIHPEYNCNEENRSTESGGRKYRKDKNREPVQQHYIPAEGLFFPEKENPFYPYQNLNCGDRNMDGRQNGSNHSDVDNHYRDAFGYPSHSPHPQQYEEHQQHNPSDEVPPQHSTHYHQQDMHRRSPGYEHERNDDEPHRPYSPMVDNQEHHHQQHAHNEQKMEEEDVEHDGPPHAPYPPHPGFFYPYPPPMHMMYPPPPSGAMIPGPPPPGAMIPGPPPPGVLWPGPPPPGALPGPPPPGAVMIPYPPFPGYPVPPPPYYAPKEPVTSSEGHGNSDPISGANKADTSSSMQYNMKNVTKGTSQKARKNARARARANRLKDEIEVIKRKPAEQRTQEEIEKMIKFEAQRNEKNRKLREKARAKKKAYLEISKKKETERTEEERKLVKSILHAKAKKGKDDRLRRIRQKNADSASIGDSNASTSAFISRSFSIQESFTEDGDRDDYLPPPPPETGTMPLYADQRQNFPLGSSLRDRSEPPSTVNTYARQATAFYNPDLPVRPRSSSWSAGKERGLPSTSERRAVSFRHDHHDDPDEHERSLSPINIEEERRPVAHSMPHGELAVDTGLSPSSWAQEFSPSMFDQSPAMRNMHISRIDEGNEGRLKRGTSDDSR